MEDGRIIWWMDMGNFTTKQANLHMKDNGTKTNFMEEVSYTMINQTKSHHKDLITETWTNPKTIGVTIKVLIILYIGDLNHDMKARNGKLMLSNG